MNTKLIFKILDDITRLNSTLYALDTTDIQRYPDNYQILACDAALRSERIACRMRQLVNTTTNIKKKEYLQLAGILHGIKISNEHDILAIELPELLPKRKQEQSSEFLLDPLYHALNAFTDKNDINKMENCIVCFNHIYNKNRSGYRIRDYDNIEEKQVLDIIATFLLIDDGGLSIDTFNTTTYGDTDCTQITIMEKTMFPGWLKERL